MSDSLGTSWSLMEIVFLGIRVAVAVVAFIVGWMLSSPVWRGLYRLVFRQGIPGALLPVLRLGSAGILAALVFVFLPLGGGGGWGWGPGAGGGPGLGPGTGKNSDGQTGANPGKKPGSKKSRERLEIEIIGGERYPGELKYYLVERKDPPLDVDEVEQKIKDRADKIDVDIILTDNSVGVGRGAESPLARLQERLDKYRIPHNKKRDPEKSGD